MIAWDAELQGRTLVLNLEQNGRSTTYLLDRDDADELSRALNDLVIESELDDCWDEGDFNLDDEVLDDEDDCS